MYDSLTVSSWVAVRDGCSMRYRVNGDEDVEFIVDSTTSTFEFVFAADPLRELLRLGANALREMDTGQHT